MLSLFRTAVALTKNRTSRRPEKGASENCETRKGFSSVQFYFSSVENRRNGKRETGNGKWKREKGKGKTKLSTKLLTNTVIGEPAGDSSLLKDETVVRHVNAVHTFSNSFFLVATVGTP